jgi:Uma2 family endonuclease
MSVVSIAEAWPSPGKPFTLAELDRMPDDGHRYELLDGVLVVSPRPTPAHQAVAFTLASLLDRACPAEWQVVPSQPSWSPVIRSSPRTSWWSAETSRGGPRMSFCRQAIVCEIHSREL